MELKNKIQELRKCKRLSQENLAEKLNVSRQAVAKWENGETFPDINNLIQFSNLFNISLDRLLKDDECMNITENNYNVSDLIQFLILAKKILMQEMLQKKKYQHDQNHTTWYTKMENLNILILIWAVKNL